MLTRRTEVVIISIWNFSIIDTNKFKDPLHLRWSIASINTSWSGNDNAILFVQYYYPLLILASSWPTLYRVFWMNFGDVV